MILCPDLESRWRAAWRSFFDARQVPGFLDVWWTVGGRFCRKLGLSGCSLRGCPPVSWHFTSLPVSPASAGLTWFVLCCPPAAPRVSCASMAWPPSAIGCWTRCRFTPVPPSACCMSMLPCRCPGDPRWSLEAKFIDRSSARVFAHVPVDRQAPPSEDERGSRRLQRRSETRSAPLAGARVVNKN